jgi:hypothetical protein
MLEIPDDPFPASSGILRPYDAIFEIDHPGSDLGDAESLVVLMADGMPMLDRLAQLDLSTVVLGRPTRVVGDGDEAYAARYVYHMRRKAGTSHDEYLDVYREHARFGHDVTGVSQYIQVHIDLDRSRHAASALGIGAWQLDSVTELYIRSLDDFFAPSDKREQLARDAFTDELRFVDRENSIQFCLAPIASAP